VGETRFPPRAPFSLSPTLRVGALFGGTRRFARAPSCAPAHAGTASSVVTTSGASMSMNELTEKTAFPGPATP